MAPSSRLDPVVRLRERTELECAAQLARAQTELNRFEVEAQKTRDGRPRPVVDAVAADQLALLERARQRWQIELNLAETRVRDARTRVEAATDAHRRAHIATEAVRRAAQNQVAVAQREAGRRESRDMDEVASLRASGALAVS